MLTVVVRNIWTGLGTFAYLPVLAGENIPKITASRVLGAMAGVHSI